jgi:hypothetical protein
MTALTAEELGAIDSEPRKPGRRPMGNRLEEGRAIGRETRKTDARDERPTRVPMYQQRSMMDTDLIPKGYHGHWFANNPPGRIEMALRAGYSFHTKDGSVYSHHVTENGVDSRVSKSGSDGVTLYLMIIPQELYEADQAAKHKIADERAGAVLGKLRGSSDFYARDESGRESTNISDGVGLQNFDHPL